MKSIWKFPLHQQNTVLYIPGPYELLTIQIQDGIATAWFIVHPDGEKKFVG